MSPLPRFLTIIFLFIAFIGFLDASYLAANHYLNVIPPCFVAQGCDVVTTSVYSKILTVPVALLGTLFYLSLLIIALFYLDKKSPAALRILPWLTGVGFLATLWFLFVQIFVIKALCTYCLLSALTSTALFVLALIIKKKSGSEAFDA